MRGWSRPDVVICLAVLAVAAAVRLPHLQTIPILTDETEDMRLGMEIARGDRPLMSQDAYNGPVFHYVMAAGYAMAAAVFVDGGDPRWPRRLALALGSLTVVLTYLVGISVAAAARAGPGPPGPAPGARPAIAWRDRAAGLIAAAIMAVAFVPVVVNSHVAWSNASSPFWAMLAVLAVCEAHRRGDPRWLVPAGALSGLACQTHASVLPVALGAALFVVWVRPGWLRTPWPWLGLAAGVAAIANVIVFNLQTGGASIVAGQGKHYAYAFGAPWPEYVVNVRDCLRMAYQLATSTFLGLDPEEGRPELLALLRSPAAVAYGTLVAAALVATARRSRLPLLTWVLVILVVSAFNRGYRYYLHARYLAAGLPLLYVAVGLWLAGWVPAPGRPGRWPRAAALAAALVLLVGYPLVRLEGFYARETALDRTGARLWQVIDGLAQRVGPDGQVRLDRGLHGIPTAGGGNVHKALDEVMDVTGTPHRKPKPEDLLDHHPGAYLVLTEAGHAALAERMVLEPVDFGVPLAPYGRGRFDVYRAVGER